MTDMRVRRPTQTTGTVPASWPVRSLEAGIACPICRAINEWLATARAIHNNAARVSRFLFLPPTIASAYHIARRDPCPATLVDLPIAFAPKRIPSVSTRARVSLTQQPC